MRIQREGVLVRKSFFFVEWCKRTTNSQLNPCGKGGPPPPPPTSWTTTATSSAFPPSAQHHWLPPFSSHFIYWNDQPPRRSILIPRVFPSHSRSWKPMSIFWMFSIFNHHNIFNNHNLKGYLKLFDRLHTYYIQPYLEKCTETGRKSCYLCC